MNDELGTLQVVRGLSVGLLSFILYLLPTIIAVRRKLKNKVIIGLVNFFLGWTVIGWIFALMWARAGASVDAPPENV